MGSSIEGILKFNVNSAARGKLEPTSIVGVLRSDKRAMLIKFSKSMAIKNSNKAKVMAILKALRMLDDVYNVKLVMKSDSSNAIVWISTSSGDLWRFHFILKEIKFLFSMIQVKLSRVLHSVNAMEDSLANQGLERPSPFVVSLM